MVKLGKKKLAELSELSKKKSTSGQNKSDDSNNGGDSAGDDDYEVVNKETKTKNETSSNKKKRASTKVSTHEESDSNGTDDLPLNGSKSSSSGAPARKKLKKGPKSKAKASTAPPATSKVDNKKPVSSSSAKINESAAQREESETGDKEFEVECILGQKFKGAESYFLVRWKGYGKDSDTWEPETELNCDDLINEYKKNNVNKKEVVNKKPAVAASSKAGRGRKPSKKNNSDPEKEWAVERILDFVNDDEHGGLYRIRWKGFGAKEDTWEPESNLSCEGLIEKFKRELEKQRNVDTKELRESPKKTKRLVNETAPRSNLHNRIERSSKRAAAKNRVFYGEE